VPVDAGASRVICPAELRLATEASAGDDLIYDPAYDPRPSTVWTKLTAIVSGSSGGSSWLVGDTAKDPATAPLAVLSQTVGAQSLVVAAEATGDGSALTGGGAIINVGDGDLRGLAGASCFAPTAEAWLLGGSTEVGSSVRLTLVNPGGTAVQVDLTLWGPAGPIDAVGTSGLTLPPNSQRVIRLDGLASASASLAVKVVATGGEIVAYIQHSRLDGLVSAGVDFVVPGASPMTNFVLPGVVSENSDLDTTDPTVLRLLAPGKHDAHVQVSLVGPQGVVDLPALEDLVVPSGVVTEVSLLGLAEGVYSALISADRPVIAAAMSVEVGQAVDTTPAEPDSTPAEPDSSPAVEGSAPTAAVVPTRDIAWSAGANAPRRGFLPVVEGTRTIAGVTDSQVTLRVVAVNADGQESAEKTIEINGGSTNLWTVADLGGNEQTIGLRYSLQGSAIVGLATVVGDQNAGTLTVLTPADSAPLARHLPIQQH
jgi:hypothetical protein